MKTSVYAEGRDFKVDTSVEIIGGAITLLDIDVLILCSNELDIEVVANPADIKRGSNEWYLIEELVQQQYYKNKEDAALAKGDERYHWIAENARDMELKKIS